MKVFEAIKKRRSIRKFNQLKQVSEEQIGKLLDAARWAPTAGNLQSFFIVVVRDQKVKDRLSEAANGQRPVGEASVVLVSCADLDKVSYYGKRGVSLYAIQDATIATQNIWLMLTELGLGAVWIGAFDEDEVAEILELPGNLRPIALLPVGYPAESPSAPRRKSIKEISKKL
jgi:nitroreductase